MSTDNESNRAEIDIRCPSGSSLLLRVLSTGEAPVEFIDSHHLQLFCKECTRDSKKIDGVQNIQRILHIFTTQGEFLRSEVQFKDGGSRSISPQAQAKIMELASQFRRG